MSQWLGLGREAGAHRRGRNDHSYPPRIERGRCVRSYGTQEDVERKSEAMSQLMLKLWNDDCGALIATEWVFVATILVLGAITGLVAVRQAAISELTEF